jgi:glycosyltransferase involved in cell wall biosynthesis/GT2 family glycosyltransferase
MRILFLTNFYLPYGFGGEDQSCRQVVEGLKQRGHTTLVLTSMYGTHNVPLEADGIYRSLFLEMDLVPRRHSITFFTQRQAREKHNVHCFERVLEQFKPDVIFIWGLWNLPWSLPALAEARYPERVVYRFATYWPTLPSQHEFYWRAPARSGYGWIRKQVLGPLALAMLARERRPPLTFKHAICVSAATRNTLVEAGIPVAHARVIYTSLDPKPYQDQPPNHSAGSDDHHLKLLYAGRLVPEKGVDTAILALEKLVRGYDLRTVRLSIAGSDSAGYEDYLRRLVTQAGLEEYVSFLGHVQPDQMPRFLKQFDLLVLPSVWPEPFSRIVLEGMISGLVVVATPNGGTAEVLTDGENGLLFAPGDADDLAQKIVVLEADPAFRQKLAWAGQRTVVERFTGTRMLDETERYLQDVAPTAADAGARQPEAAQYGSHRSALPSVSVIIPTYNRKGPLRQTLQSIAQQTYPRDRFEVIVVDDGSTDGTGAIAAETFPFPLRLVRQSNQGDAAARNFGARQSEADILVFLDDDIVVEPGYLAHLVQTHDRYPNRIVAGVWDLWPVETSGLSQTSKTLLASGAYYARSPFPQNSVEDLNSTPTVTEAPLVGMMQPLEFSGSSMWCDLEFNYRAYCHGFEFRRNTKAICWHRDRSADSLDDFKKHMRTAAYRSVTLFQKHPGLIAHVPMFQDKTPIRWGRDTPRLIARKLARALISSRPALWSMEQLVHVLETLTPKSSLLPALYRYIVGGYVFQGYRQGLGEFGPIEKRNGSVRPS